MKCKICGDEINLVVFGLPDDVCWDCAQNDVKESVVETNIQIDNELIRNANAVPHVNIGEK